MEVDKKLAVIKKYNIVDNSKITEVIGTGNHIDAVNSFRVWANELTLNTFEIISTNQDLKITFTIYPRTSTDSIHIIVISGVVFNKIKSKKTYKIENKIKDLDIDNMSDIISLLIRISIGDIVYLKDSSAIDLIDFQMKRIATEIY